MNAKRGFTLIELLVVIAIIGILAGIVLASLGNARGKGNDAKVRGQLNSVRNSAAEEYFLGNSSTYGPPNGAQTGLCTAASGGSVMWTDVPSGMNTVITNTINIGGVTLDCGVTSNGYSVAATLPSGAGYWCVDSTGAARSFSSTTNTAYTGLTGSNSLTTAHYNAGSANCN